MVFENKRYDTLFNKWSWSHAFEQKYQAKYLFDAIDKNKSPKDQIS